MTSFFLKVVAILAMTIDHFASVIGQAGLLTLFPGASMKITSDISQLMTVIGRMAFPLFAFMIAEGCHKTRDIKKYIGRLAVFAAISEPFFYFAHHYRQPDMFAGFWENLAGFHLENVFFTLTISAAAIACYQLLKEKAPEKAKFFFLPIVLIASFAAQSIDADYGIFGVILILALYVAPTKKSKVFVTALWSIGVYGIGSLAHTSFRLSHIQSALSFTVGAALSCLFIWFYNGQRGRKTKWLFYLYYPAHFFVLLLFGLFLFQ